MGMSPYVAEMRGLIGQRALLLPAVSLIIEDDRGRLLLVRQDAQGPWFTVGGMVEPDEDPLTAAHREAREEPVPDMDEVGEVGWFARHELARLRLSVLNTSLLADLGITGRR